VADGVPFIRAADMSGGMVDFHAAGKINGIARTRIRKGVGAPGDVILSHKGTVGKVAVAPADSPDFVCSPQTTFWRSIDGDVIDQRYLKFVLVSADFGRQLDVLKGQTDMAPYVSLTDQRSMELELPAIAEQRAIAEVLGALDDKIAGNARLVGTSEELAVAIASESVPTVALGEIVSHHKRAVDPNSVNDALVEHFSLPAFDTQHAPEVVAPRAIKSGKFEICQPSVLVSKLNPRFPRIWDVPASGTWQGLASTEFLVLESRFSSSSVLWSILSQPIFSASLESQVAGTSGSHQRVRPADLLATHVIDPRTMPDPAKDAITSLGLCVAAYRSESTTLAATRDTLLPLLMSGEITVKTAKRAAGEVV